MKGFSVVSSLQWLVKLQRETFFNTIICVVQIPCFARDDIIAVMRQRGSKGFESLAMTPQLYRIYTSYVVRRVIYWLRGQA